MSNDLIKKRNERTKQRKERKKKFDSIIGLAKSEDGRGLITLSADVATISDTNQIARLLDEGYCDNGFVLMKGTIEKYLNGQNQYVTGWEMKDGSWQRTEVLNLTDDFVGTVNLGHKEFATDPFILGEFKKSDFTLVSLENDRKALDVEVRLDEESVFVKELRRQPYDIGVSAEFYYHVDWDATEKLESEYGMYMPVIDEIFIFAYGLVGECGNVNSSGLELKGEPMNKTEEIIENAILDTDNEQELGVEEIDITVNEEEELVAEETAETEEGDNEAEEADAEEEAEEVAEEEAESEEADVEEAEGDGEEDGSDEAEDSDEEELAIVSDLRGQIQALNDRINELEEANAKLKKTNRKLSNKYQNELDKKEKFKQELKGLSAELLPEEEVEEKKEQKVTKRSRDGIGEL